MRQFLIIIMIMFILGCSTSGQEVKQPDKLDSQKQEGVEFPAACEACPEGECVGWFLKGEEEFSCVYYCQEGLFYPEYCEDGKGLYDRLVPEEEWQI